MSIRASAIAVGSAGWMAMHANDNVRTPHLKCDRCRARTSLKRIEAKAGGEIRTFECASCFEQNYVYIRSAASRSDANEDAC